MRLEKVDRLRFGTASELLDDAVEQLRTLDRPTAVDREIRSLLETVAGYLEHRAGPSDRTLEVRP